MSISLRLIFLVLMATALGFGYTGLFVGHDVQFDFERLHIFLFNLCSGGTILVYFTENSRKLTGAGKTFLILSLSYALLAFYEIYLPALIVGVLLAGLVEAVRVRHFSWTPKSFFSPVISVQTKFHHAALVCLSLGLLASSLVIANNEFFFWLELSKLELNTFFLGFSVPISLISMSVIFSQINSLGTESQPESINRLVKMLKETCFWTINLGVIIFFLFILFDKLVLQVIVASILFCAVMLIYMLYRNLGNKLQQKYFLTSGMLFLVATAITGILYIVVTFEPAYHPEKYKFLLKIHAYLSLYGWNLSGLAVIVRQHEFPIQLHSGKLVALHWSTVLVLCPLGYYNQIFAVAAVCSYIVILYFFLFQKGMQDASLSELSL
ncbi:MAG: hypothetical protein ABFS09_02865 [Thermodesulfobacteriota bacterium]